MPDAERLPRILGALHARVPLGMRLGLEPMREACARLGHPERAFACVHIAGTNGKGSVSAMVEAMARASGKRTGLYTSPHLCRFAERIRVDGQPVDEQALLDALEEALTRGPDLSFFETATLAAFLAFRARGVELAVLEVGLGGRLDATNVIPCPAASAVTTIALDHTDVLGPDLPTIAREKAAIAKPGSTLIVGPMEAGARAAIDEVARSLGATTESVDEDEDPALLGALQMPGLYQVQNARIALSLARRLALPEQAMRRGLEGARWPGRFEWIDAEGGPVILDAAHNLDGARALVRAVAEAERRGARGWPEGARARDPRALVFGALADKAWPEMLEVVAPLGSARFYTAPRGRLPADPAKLAGHRSGMPCASVEEALALARAAVGREGLILVCGSIYLVGEARAKLLEEPMDPVVAL